MISDFGFRIADLEKHRAWSIGERNDAAMRRQGETEKQMPNDKYQMRNEQ